MANGFFRSLTPARARFSGDRTDGIDGPSDNLRRRRRRRRRRQMRRRRWMRGTRTRDT